MTTMKLTLLHRWTLHCQRVPGFDRLFPSFPFRSVPPWMDLYFSRRRFFETSFYAPCGRSEVGLIDLAEVYRVSTTVRKYSIFPHVTTIEYVAPEDEEKRYVVATIEWRWPSPIASVIEINDKKFMLKDFLQRDLNLLKTGTHVMIGDERFTWRSAVFRPAQLYDSNKRSVAQYNNQVRSLRPFLQGLSLEPGCLHIEQDIAPDADIRDMVVASFFVYRACRDLRILFTPWWRAKEADFKGIKLLEEDEVNIDQSWYTISKTDEKVEKSFEAGLA